MSIEQIKAQSRRALHDFMGRAASYYPEPHLPDSPRSVVKVRYHSNVAKAGDLAGTNLSYAETQDRAEEVVFWRPELPNPVRNSLVILSAEEGYFVNNVSPPDGLTITAEVVRAAQKDLNGKLDPNGVLIGG